MVTFVINSNDYGGMQILSMEVFYRMLIVE